MTCHPAKAQKNTIADRLSESVDYSAFEELGEQKGRLSKTFGESPSALSELRLLTETYRT